MNEERLQIAALAGGQVLDYFLQRMHDDPRRAAREAAQAGLNFADELLKLAGAPAATEEVSRPEPAKKAKPKE